MTSETRESEVGARESGYMFLTGGDVKPAGARRRRGLLPAASMTSVSDVDKARLEAAREQIQKLMQRDAKVKDESDLYNKLIKQVCAVAAAQLLGLQLLCTAAQPDGY